MQTRKRVAIASTDNATTNILVTNSAKSENLWLGIGLCSLSGISYGAQALFVKWAYAEGVNTTTVLTLRFVVAALGCWLMVGLFRPQTRLTNSKKTGLLALGLIFVFNALFYYLSLDKLDAGTAALLGSTFPGWVVLWSALFLKEKLDKRRSIALLLALSGCLLTIDPFNLSSGKFSLFGAVLALGSAFSYSFYILLSNKLGKNVPSVLAAAYSLLATASVYILWCLFTGQFQWQMSGAGWLYCLAIGVGAAIAIGTYQAGIQLIGPSRAAITGTTEPATAVLLGILVLNENANLIKLIGGCLIIGAVLLLSRSRSKQSA